MSESTEPQLVFRGGAYASVVPIAVFLVVTVGLVIAGSAEVEGMILAAMIGISAGMLLARNVSAYSERTFTLMANRVATVAVVCWLWAGVFSAILAASGLVEAMVWIGWKLNLTGEWLVLAVFLSAALFAVSVGTGLGTIVGFTAVMYPAGVLLGGEPAVLIGAILSGAALGDNLAPISDTTIVSAATQETDVGGVVRSRLKYVAITVLIAGTLFVQLGGSSTTIDAATSEAILAETADPKGLPMLIPAILVFVVAVSGGHFLAALTVGVVAAVIIGPLAGVFPISDVFRITDDGKVAGSAVEGALSLMTTSILTLLLVTAIGIMAAGGFLEKLLRGIRSFVGTSAQRAEWAIFGLISFTNVSVSVNTVAMITTGPPANEIRKTVGLQSYRVANILDTISCSFPYILPYATASVAAVAIQTQVAAKYPAVPVVPWEQFVPFYFYGHVLLGVMMLSILTGFGRRQG